MKSTQKNAIQKHGHFILGIRKKYIHNKHERTIYKNRKELYTVLANSEQDLVSP